MPTRAPFTATVRLDPAATARRTEQVRELQRLGYLIGQALEASSTLWVAQPGGGTDRNHSLHGDQLADRAVAVKPAFGDTPAQATVVGYWDNGQEYPAPAAPTVTRISGGRAWTGVDHAPWSNPPEAATAAEAQALIADLESCLAGLPAEVLRVEYANRYWYAGSRRNQLVNPDSHPDIVVPVSSYSDVHPL